MAQLKNVIKDNYNMMLLNDFLRKEIKLLTLSAGLVNGLVKFHYCSDPLLSQSILGTNTIE